MQQRCNSDQNQRAQEKLCPMVAPPPRNNTQVPISMKTDAAWTELRKNGSAG